MHLKWKTVSCPLNDDKLSIYGYYYYYHYYYVIIITIIVILYIQIQDNYYCDK